MMTPEIIHRHFRGPVRKKGTTTWVWHQKGRRWPRTSFHLIYQPRSRTFSIDRLVRQSAKSNPIPAATESDPVVLAGFRACLTPADIAACTLASIKASEAVIRYPDRLIQP